MQRLRVYTNLYIKNFPADWDEEKLKDLLKEASIAWISRV